MNSFAIEWVRQQPSFNTELNDYWPSIATDALGNSYIAYETTGLASGQEMGAFTDIVVFKLDANGNTLWVTQKSTFNTQGEVENSTPSIATDITGNCYIAYQGQGQASGQTNTGGYDIIVFKLDTSGQLQWVTQQPTFNTNHDDHEPQIATDESGNSCISYYTSGTVSGQTNVGATDIVVFRLDTNGILIWVKEAASFNADGADSPSDIAMDPEGNCYVTYSTTGAVSGQSNSGDQNIVVFKLNVSGDTLWVTQNPLFNTENAFISTIAVGIDGSCVVAYITDVAISGQTSSGDYDIVVFKLDTNGQFIWVTQNPMFNTSAWNIFPSISVDLEGNCYIAYSGFSDFSSSVMPEDITLVKLTREGVLVQIAIIPTISIFTYENMTPQITYGKDGHVYLAYQTLIASSGQTSTGGLDITVYKFDEVSNEEPEIDLIGYSAQFHGHHHGRVGQIIDYQYTIKNTGQVTLNDITITDTRATNITLDKTSLIINETTTGTGTTVVTQADIDRGYIISFATAMGTYGSQTTRSSQLACQLAISRHPSLKLTPTSNHKMKVKNNGNVTLSHIKINKKHKIHHLRPDHHKSRNISIVESIKFKISPPTPNP